MVKKTKTTALILAGAVAKGAFEAGALTVLAEYAEDLPISRIVGASSGALNAAVFATGVRASREIEVAQNLAELWEHEATWGHVLNLSPSAIFGLRGAGNADHLIPIMKNAMADVEPRADRRKDVSLGLVLTVLGGRDGTTIGGQAATTFEHTVDFDSPSIDTGPGRDRIIETALGSAAFPGLFEPRDVPGIGRCIDGGAVNNTPIKRAFANGKVDRVVIVTSQPLATRPSGDPGGLELVSQIADILINERIYRDLHDADSVNEYLNKLQELAAQGVPGDTIEKVRQLFGWTPLEIVQVRPRRALEGNAFHAFCDRGLMKDYVTAGKEVARAAVGAIGLSA